MNLELLTFEPYLLLPLALVLVMMALPIVSRRLHGPVSYILPGDLVGRLLRGGDIAVLDLRPKKEFERRHIEGAINVGAGDVESKLADNEALVLVCASDLKSTQLAGKLGKKGVSGIMVLKGGMYKWKDDHQQAVSAGAASAERS